MRLSVAFTVLAALALMSAMPEARAQEVVADLSSHLVAITTGFTGTSVVLFGSVEGSGDVIVVVNGPTRDIVVRHKSKIAAVWINTSQVIYQGVPSFYSVASSKPLNEIAPPALRQMQQIGIENLRLTPDRVLTQAEAADFRAALIRNQQRAGLYVPDVASVSFLGNRLFRATIAFPANVPTGNFLVQVFLIRNGALVGAQSVPLVVSQVGLDARVHDFADRFALAYGIIAVGLAAIAGWLASLPFRNA